MPTKASLLSKDNIALTPEGRVSFSQEKENFVLDNFLQHHLDSWQEFITEGVKDLLRDITPLEMQIRKNDLTYDLSLNFHDYRFDEPKIDDQEALATNKTYQATLRVKVELINHTTTAKKTQEIYLGEYPWMTSRGTFIVNGLEHIVTPQIIRSPGVFFEPMKISLDQKLKFGTDKSLFGAKIIPDRGIWLLLETSLRDNAIFIIINRKYRLPVTNFLLALGLTKEGIYKALSPFDTGDIKYLEATFNHKNSVDDYRRALLEVYKCLRPGDLVTLENAKEALQSRFFNHRIYNLSKTGRHKINQRLNLKTPNTLENHVLNKEDLLAIVAEIIRLNNTPNAEGDETDDLVNRRIKMVSEIVKIDFRKGLRNLEKNIRERMMRLEIDNMNPQQLINARPVTSKVNNFFNIGRLSRNLKQVNPLSELAQKRLITATGPGGLKSEYAKFDVRDCHPTHYSRICPVETPEGKQIGLNLNMALYARVNKFGFLEAPYYEILKEVQAANASGEIARLDLVDESNKVIVKAAQTISAAAAKKLSQVDKSRLWPIKPRVLKDKVVYLDVQGERDKLMLSADAEVDAQGYFVNEFEQGRLSNIASRYNINQADYIDVSVRQIIGVAAGLIPFIEKDEVARSLVGANQVSQAVPLIQPKSPIVGTGLEALIAKNSAQVIYAKADGEVVSVTADEVIVDYGREKIKYPVRHFRLTNDKTSANQRVIVDVGQKVKKGEPLVDGMAIDHGELALGRDILTAFMFWGGNNFEDAVVISERLVKDDILTSVYIKKYDLEVRDTRLGPEITTSDIPNVSEDSLRHLDETGIIRVGAKVRAGDILVGKITPKGERELSNEERLLRAIFGEKAKDVSNTSLVLPDNESGKVIEVKVFAKDEGHTFKSSDVIKHVRVFIAQNCKIQIGDKIAGRHGNKGIIARILPEEDMPFTEDGTPVDIVLNPLGVPTRMNIGQSFEAHLGLAAEKLGIKVVSPPFKSISKEMIEGLLEEANLPIDGRQQLYDGRTGQPFINRTTVGQMYIYKLAHMVKDKIGARSTGGYTKDMQQPLGGKAQGGGQKMGEMEVWSLWAYGAAYTLREMLTIKSDDIYGRFKAYEAIIKQQDIVEFSVPESFNVLVKNLQSLGLRVDFKKYGEDNFVDAEEVLHNKIMDEEKQAQATKTAMPFTPESTTAELSKLPLNDPQLVQEMAEDSDLKFEDHHNQEADDLKILESKEAVLNQETLSEDTATVKSQAANKSEKVK